MKIPACYQGMVGKCGSRCARGSDGRIGRLGCVDRTPLFFKAALAIQMLSALRNDESAYVRDSVGNAWRDISKKHPILLKNEFAKWGITSHKYTN
jgi:hypothetical protein